MKMLLPQRLETVPSRWWLFLVTIAMACLCLAGCVSNRSCQGPLPPFASDVSTIDTSLITGKPCSPPCWQDLIPGASSSGDVESRLARIPFINQTWTSSSDLETYFYWTTTFSDDSTEAGFIVVNATGKISYIYLRFLGYQLSVEQLIASLGTPDWVFIAPPPPQTDIDISGNSCYKVELIWLEKGLRVMLPHKTQRDSQNWYVAPDTIVLSAFYFPPVSTISEYLSSLGTSQSTFDYYHKWEGFQDNDG